VARTKTVSDTEVLEEARRCFLAHGPGVSTDVIAESLEISQPTIFKRFGTKKALMLAALLPPAVPDWVHALEDGPDDRPIVEQLREVIRQAAAFFAEVVPAMMVIRASGISHEELLASFEVAPPIVAKQTLIAWLLRSVERGLIRPVDPEAAATMILGALQFRAFMVQITRSAPFRSSDEEYVDYLADLLVHGLAPEENR
jgi:AcrR family transcriptional regulator